MILNREYGFLFIKTMRTAGTSLEIALSSIAGSDDIITPLTGGDEQRRKALGFTGPRNFGFGKNRYLQPGRQIPAAIARRGFYDHIPASHLRALLGKEYAELFKFSIIRNPWDRMISQYLHFTAGLPDEQRPSLKAFVRHNPALVNANERMLFDLDTDDLLVDAVICYENLDRGVAEIERRLGIKADLCGLMSQISAESQSRPEADKRYDLFCEYSDSALTLLCRREIERFRYRCPFDRPWLNHTPVPRAHLNTMAAPVGASGG